MFSRAFVATASSKMSCQGGVLTWLVLLVCGRSGGFHEPFQWDMRIRVKAEDEDFAGDKKKHSTHFFYDNDIIFYFYLVKYFNGLILYPK